jgi:hypothetical protein
MTSIQRVYAAQGYATTVWLPEDARVLLTEWFNGAASVSLAGDWTQPAVPYLLTSVCDGQTLPDDFTLDHYVGAISQFGVTWYFFLRRVA